MKLTKPQQKVIDEMKKGIFLKIYRVETTSRTNIRYRVGDLFLTERTFESLRNKGLIHFREGIDYKEIWKLKSEEERP
jgi:hypothetical protein